MVLWTRHAHAQPARTKCQEPSSTIPLLTKQPQLMVASFYRCVKTSLIPSFLSSDNAQCRLPGPSHGPSSRGHHRGEIPRLPTIILRAVFWRQRVPGVVRERSAKCGCRSAGREPSYDDSRQRSKMGVCRELRTMIVLYTQ